VSVKVATVDADYEFTIQSNTIGRQLFHQASCRFTHTLAFEA